MKNRYLRNILLKALYPDIEELNTYLEKVLSDDDPPEILDIEEGELSILKSNIYKVTTKLKYQKELLKQDKVTLATAMADISHQLKTPLTSMMVMNDLLKSEEDGEKREEFLKTQSDQLDRMNWLIQTLLKLSKLDAGSVLLTKEDVPAGELIKEVMKPFEIQLDIKNISFVSEIPDVFVMCDKNWTVEAVQNIVKNCIEHMDEGGSLKVSLIDTNIFSQILISDTGCGIAAEDIPHVFERFYRGKNAGKDSVGIGLALAKTIIESQHGEISVISETGVGSTFDIKLYKTII
jgi:signal transduction histidine kinase